MSMRNLVLNLRWTMCDINSHVHDEFYLSNGWVNNTRRVWSMLFICFEIVLYSVWCLIKLWWECWDKVNERKYVSSVADQLMKLLTHTQRKTYPTSINTIHSITIKHTAGGGVIWGARHKRRRSDHGFRSGASRDRRVRALPENQLSAHLFAGDFCGGQQFVVCVYGGRSQLSVSDLVFCVYGTHASYTQMQRVLPTRICDLRVPQIICVNRFKRLCRLSSAL